MKLISDEPKKERKLEGQTVNIDKKDDRSHIKDLGTFPKMVEPEIDDTITSDCASQFVNGECKRNEADKFHDAFHEEKWDAVESETTRSVHPEQGVLKNKLESQEDHLEKIEELIKSNRPFYNKIKHVFSMSWDPLSKTKFWTAILGVFTGISFGVANLFRNIRENNLLFVDSSDPVVLMCSLVFVVPVLAIKGRFDQISDPEMKQRYMLWVFRSVLVSGAFFLLVFGYVNSPREIPFMSGDPSSYVLLSKNVLNFLYLLANILLELSTSTYLTLIASQIYENNIVLTDQYKTQHACESYEKLLDQRDEIKRNIEILKRRLKAMDRYFKELKSQKQLYMKKVRIALSRKIRRL